jgi:Lon-like ATP-dependent protease
MNKLLKVLEDRRVYLESAYYSAEDTNIPQHIHEIFQKGLPADFRLVGATTKMPEDIPVAIRSRCVEIFFRPLRPDEVMAIALNAVKRIGFEAEEGALNVIKRYAANGREAVNMVQLAAGLVQTEGRKVLRREDLEWVVNNGQHNPRPDYRLPDHPQVGFVNGMAVYGPNMGTLIEIEASAIPAAQTKGSVIITGVIDEEEMGGHGRTVRRKGMAKGSMDNVITVLRRNLGLCPHKYDLHVNFPGGVPIDGPSAGIAIVTALYSAITDLPVDNLVAMTGEISIRGFVRPVGGIVAKLEAARLAGVRRRSSRKRTGRIPLPNWGPWKLSPLRGSKKSLNTQLPHSIGPS